MMSEPEQSNEHDEKEGDIGNEHRSNRQFITLGIGRPAGKVEGHPFSADLRMDRFRRNQIMVIIAYLRDTCCKHIFVNFVRR